MSTPVNSGHTNHHTVAMKDFLHLAGGKIEIIPGTVITPKKTVSVRMAFNSARNQFELVCHKNCILAISQDLPFSLHGTQSAGKRRRFVVFNSKESSERTLLHRFSRLSKGMQYELSTGKGILVTFALACEKRVFATLKAGLGHQLSFRYNADLF
jgi:hypothetical protein